MEQELRALLYQQFPDRKLAFNPVEPEPFDLVDLTQDVTNATRIYHLRTECVREALEGASLIITDSEALANVVRSVLPKARVVAIPYGLPPTYSYAKKTASVPIVGLLNHNGDVEQNNAYALALLKTLRPKGGSLLVYGHELPDLEAEVTEDFEQFAAKCDILLLPSLPGAINSTTLPLALMSAGTALLCHNAPGYYDLDAATGVQLLPNDPDVWRWMLGMLETQPVKLQAMQERNRAFAIRLNRESLQRALSLIATSAIAQPALSEGCGCEKKKKSKSSPAQPSPSPEPVVSEPDEETPTQPIEQEKEQ